MVAGEAPGLPFSAHAFDAIMATFVLAHVTRYQTAVAELVQLLTPGGRLGASVWAAGGNVFGATWKEVAATVVPAGHLEQAVRAVIPWEAWFAHPPHLQAALEAAGLGNSAVCSRTYELRMSIGEYLAMRAASVEGTVVRRLITDDEWVGLQWRLQFVFGERFSEPLVYTREVHFGLGAAMGD